MEIFLFANQGICCRGGVVGDYAEQGIDISESLGGHQMKLFENILTAIYKFYSKYDRINPYISTIAVLAALILCSLIYIIQIINKIFGYNIPQIISKPLILSLTALVFIALYKYYTKDKIESYLPKFNTKSLMERRFWTWLPLIILVIIFFSLYLIFKLL